MSVGKGTRPTARPARALRWLLVSVFAIGAAARPLATAEPREPGEAPRESKIVETAGTRLAQIDVSLAGPLEAISSLSKDDFEVKVNRRRVLDFSLDLSCASAAPEDGQRPPDAPRTEAKPRPASYVFYFDMPWLTMVGRQRAMDMAVDLIPALVQNGNRGMILSNARALDPVAPFTTDAAELLRSLKALASDKLAWDPYPSQERNRLAEVQRTLNEERQGFSRAIALARGFYLEDRRRARRDIGRLTMSLGSLSQVDAPKAILYFADTMRDDAGGLYLKLFSDAVIAQAGAKPFELGTLQRVIEEASAQGVRFYTIQAEGLTAPFSDAGMSVSGSYGARLNVPTSGIGTADAQAALVTLAAETGGRSFLNGVPADRVARAVSTDLACIALLSFDPEGFSEDAPLPVTVRVRNPRITAHTRGLIVLQSDSARRTSKLLAAFIAPEAKRNEVPVRTALVPTGFVDGRFTALVQVAVAGSSVPGAWWDLGASLVSRERVRDEGSVRIRVDAPNTPAAFEKEMAFSPGAYELVSVAMDATTGQVGSRRDEGTWPDPEADDVLLGPIAVLQPAAGAFSRDGRTATTGALARTGDDAVRADAPTALVGIVCRRKGLDGPLRLERKLEGEIAVPFAPMELDLGDDRCAQIRDLVRGGTMRAGFFRYEIRVVKNGLDLARAERSFPVIVPEPAPPSSR